MVGQITTVLAEAHHNIFAMINQNRAELAYNIIDIEGIPAAEVAEKISTIEGIISVRLITNAENSIKTI